MCGARYSIGTGGGAGAAGSAGRLEVHHLRSLHDGGAMYHMANLEARCRPCHFGEHRRPLGPGALAWKRLVAVIQERREE